jgi:diguanylate cyclase (GGDEF)-like protein
MQPQPRTARTASTDFQILIDQGSNEIAQLWREAIKADTSELRTERVAEPLLSDSVPIVLDEILSFIGSNKSKIDPEKINQATRRVRERVSERFDVREVVRECQLLREYLFLYLHEHVADFARRETGGMMNIYRRAGLASDDAMRETINAFVENYTEQLRHLSRTDSLTGLYNHATFYARLDEELNRARRYKTALSIVLIDLDNFKSVNDTRGHQFGDYLLVKCANWLRAELRQTDVVCRYGGDEFAVILPETTAADGCIMMARLVNGFKEFGVREGAPTSFGMCFGLAAHPEDNGTMMRMVKVADQRLLLNKQERLESPLGSIGGDGETRFQRFRK